MSIIHNRRRLLLAGAAASLGVATRHASAQHQSSFIRIFVGFSAGGATDNVMRTVAAELTPQLNGRPIVIENKAGANQIAAIQALRSAPADGDTLFLGTGSSLAQNPAVQKSLGYVPKDDFTPIAMIGTSPGVFMIRSSLPIKTLADLIDYAKKNPGKLNYGSSGVGSANQLSMEAFLLATGTQMVHIPLKADSAVMLEMEADRLDVSISTMQVAVQAVQTGKVRMLALTSVEPLSFAPGIPTLKEARVPGLEGLDPFTFYGLVGPKGVPKDVVQKLNQAVNKVLADADVIRKLQDTMKVNPTPCTPEQFEAYLGKEFSKWSAIGQRIKLDR